jgi:hypothetical protein
MDAPSSAVAYDFFKIIPYLTEMGNSDFDRLDVRAVLILQMHCTHAGTIPEIVEDLTKLL